MGSALVAELVELLKANDASFAVAESCTGGLLSAEIVSCPGVSAVYRGAVVSYDNRVKQHVLGVPKSLLATHGAVSRPVAREMAQAVRRELEATWSCSITGIAGPGGGSPEKPVGTVYFGVSGPGVDRTEHQRFTGDRASIQRQSVEFALRLLVAAVSAQEL